MGTIVHGTILWIYGLSMFKQTWPCGTWIHWPLGLFRGVSIQKKPSTCWRFKHRGICQQLRRRRCLVLSCFGCLSCDLLWSGTETNQNPRAQLNAVRSAPKNWFQMCFTNLSNSWTCGSFLRSTHHPASQVSKRGRESLKRICAYSKLEQSCIFLHQAYKQNDLLLWDTDSHKLTQVKIVILPFWLSFIYHVCYHFLKNYHVCYPFIYHFCYPVLRKYHVGYHLFIIVVIISWKNIICCYLFCYHFIYHFIYHFCYLFLKNYHFFIMFIIICSSFPEKW